MSETPYQVYLFVGGSAPPSPAGVTLVDVTPSAPSVEAAVAALEASGLTAADLRTRTLFIAAGDAQTCVLAYAAACGFAGRRLDYTDLHEVVDARSIHVAATGAPDLGKPDELPEVVQVGHAHADPSVTSLVDLAEVSPEDVTFVRYARRARLALRDRTPRQSLDLFVTMAGLRMRSEADRFPFLVTGEEPYSTDPDDAPPGIDLDQARRSAAELRRARRVDDRAAVVEPLPLTARQMRLQEAAEAPAHLILSGLGSTQDEETGFWRCPRPERHRNGDANPSTRVVDGLVRCFRCDTEPVDSLRLVMDCLDLGPDDACSWIRRASLAAS